LKTKTRTEKIKKRERLENEENRKNSDKKNMRHTNNQSKIERNEDFSK
jgi:hypothetical protein